MLRAVSQIVTSNAAATRITTAAIPTQTRHRVQSSASVMAILLGRALVQIVPAASRSIDAPETFLLVRAPPRPLRAHMLPLRVEILDRLVHRGLRLDVRPAARHLAEHVPAMLP